jgi:hypothetical protein
MKKILGIVALSLLLFNISFSKTYKTGQEVEGQIVFDKKTKINLPKGIWTIAAKEFWNWHGLNLTDYTLIKTKDNELMEVMTVGEFQLGGIATGRIDTALFQINFKNKYDGCYERPEYYVLKFYRKGNVHNCFKISHIDIMKEINDPDDPEVRGTRRIFNNWLKNNSIIVPKVSLASSHNYFSRHAGGNWYVVNYIINPKILNAPKNKFYTEESSEYHKYNIEQFPGHKKIMQKWLSISAERHKRFEESVKAKNKHKLDLSNYYSAKIKPKDKLSNNFITQIKQLNDLYKSGALTKEEFEKAKKKILN